MKKIVCFMLAIILVLGLVGCSQEKVESSEASESVSDIEKEENSESEVESTPIESETSEFESETTETVPCWKIQNYVDEFGDETDEIFIMGEFSGKFSNTATSGSDLKVIVSYDYYYDGRYFELTPNPDPKVWEAKGSNVISFTLLEFNENRATYNSSDNITLKIKLNDTVTEYTLSGSVPNQNVFIADSNADGSFCDFYQVFNEALYNNINIPCIIEIGSSKYSFEINANGFKETDEKYIDIKFPS